MRTLSDFKITGRAREVGRFQKNGGADLVILFHEHEGKLYFDILIESRLRARPDGSPMPQQWIGVREQSISDFFAAIDKARALFEGGNIFNEPAPGTNADGQSFKE